MSEADHDPKPRQSIYIGTVPPVRLNRVLLPEASIYLIWGRHVGPNRGHGISHIWAEHREEMERCGLKEIGDVPAYVSTIVRSGTPLFYEGAQFKVTRVLAVRSTSGTAVLEFRDRLQGPIWSVVTAFSGTKTHGTRVGTVR